EHGLFAVLDRPTGQTLYPRRSRRHAQPRAAHVASASAAVVTGAARGAAPSADQAAGRRPVERPLERTAGRGLDERAPGTPGRRAAGLRLSAAAALLAAGSPAAACARRCGGPGAVQKKLRSLIQEVATAFPDAQVELWATDEHRLGPNPPRRRVSRATGPPPPRASPPPV